jgi:cytochrome b561
LRLYNWHKWAGVLILLLSVARLVTRLVKRPPELPAAIASAMPGWQTQAYHSTQGMLCALFFAVPLLGWAYSLAAGFPIVLLGLLPLPDLVDANKALAETIKPWHA